MMNDTLSAIAVMTAAVDDPDGPKKLAAQVVNEWSREDPDEGANRVVLGFVQLCTMLLAKIQVETGMSAEATLQETARIMSNWSEED